VNPNSEKVRLLVEQLKFTMRNNVTEKVEQKVKRIWEQYLQYKLVIRELQNEKSVLQNNFTKLNLQVNVIK